MDARDADRVHPPHVRRIRIGGVRCDIGGRSAAPRPCCPPKRFWRDPPPRYLLLPTTVLLLAAELEPAPTGTLLAPEASGLADVLVELNRDSPPCSAKRVIIH